MITYGSTTLTSYNTITKIEVYYYKSTSATSLSGGSWSTTKPTWENGKYIWQKIRTTYEGKLENGQYYSESDPVNITGQQGATGTAAYSYKLNASDTNITVSKDGTYSKTSVTFSATYKQGTGAVNTYAGRFKIETTANGTTWTTQYTSSANESSKEYTIPTGILNIRCSLYQADGTSVLLDIVSVAIVTDGKDGTDGTSQNLLLDVYATSLDKVKAPWARYLSDASNTSITGEFIAESNLPDPNATHFYRITDSSASTKGRGLCFYNGGTPPFINGHTYRIGCWVRNHSGKPRLYIYLGSVGDWLSHKTIENTEWEWMECVRTFGDTDPTINGQASTYKRIYFYLSNNNVADSSLDMCGFKIEEIQTDISTARNYLLKTEKLEGWGVTGGATISNGIATFPEVTANTWREIYPTKNFKYELIRNKNIIFSVRVKADVGKICACNFCIGVDSTETAYTRQKYKNNYVYFTGDGEWHTICIATPISDELFTGGSGTPDYDNCWVTVRISAVNSYHNGFQLKQPQLSLGTTATTWSAAPEDIEASMQEKVDNIEIGGRNLLRNSATFLNWPKSNEITINDNIASATNTTATSNVNYLIRQWVGSGELNDYLGTPLVMSFDIMSPDWDAVTEGSYSGLGAVAIEYSCVSEPYGSSVLHTGRYLFARLNNTNFFNVPESIPNNTWIHVTSKPIILEDSVFNNDTSKITGYDYLMAYFILIRRQGTVYLKNPKVERGTKPTDWTPAPEDVEESIKAYAESIQSQVDGMAEIHYGTAVPTLSNAPYTSWADTATKDMHVDDLYYNTSTGYCYRFTKSGSTYSWTRIKDSDITAAATAASDANTAAGNAQTTANNANALAGQKRRIFVNQPTPPYEIGDLWVEGSSGDIKKCKTARATGSYTASDWELASKYTDDTTANTANTKVDNLKKVRLGWKVNYSAYNTANNGECYFHGYDSNNAPSDIDGIVEWNGADLTITKGMWINPNKVTPFNTPVLHVYRTDVELHHADVWWDETQKKWRGYMYKENHTPDVATDATSAAQDWVWNETTDCILATYISSESEGAITSAQLFNPPKKFSELPDPSLAQNLVDNLEIGGRNLLKNSKALTDNWKLNQATVSDGVVTVTPTVSGDRRMYQMPAAGYWVWTAGQEYTVSVAARSDNGASFIFQANGAGRASESIVTDSTWKRYSFTFVASKAETSSMAFSIVETSDKTIQFKEPKLEYGAKATDWTLAPEDTDANIQQVQDNLDNLKIGGRNLIIGTLNPDARGSDMHRPHLLGQTVNTSGRGTCTVAEHGLRFTLTEANWCYIYFGASGNTATPSMLGLTAGETYTLSADLSWKVLSSDTGKASTATYYMSGLLMYSTAENLTAWSTAKYEEQTPITQADKGTDMSGRLVFTFTVPEDAVRLYLGIRVNNTTASHYAIGDYIEARNMKLEKGSKATDWSPAPEDMQAGIDTALAQANTALEQSVEYIVGTQTAATGTWTGATTDNELKIGKTIAYKLPYAGSGNASLVLTLANGSTTDAIPVYLNTTRVTTHFGANSVINMTYDGQYWRASSIPNTNNYDRRQHNNAITAKTAITEKHLIVGDSTGYQQITSTSGGSLEFDLGYPILWAYSDIAATKTSTATYEAYPSVNFSTSGTIQDGAANKMLWLKGTIRGNIFTLASTNFLTTRIPTSDDGMYYIPLGIMSSATAGYFSSSNRIYAYIDEEFQPLDNAAALKASSAYETAVQARSEIVQTQQTLSLQIRDISVGGANLFERTKTFEGTANQSTAHDSFTEFVYKDLTVKSANTVTFGNQVVELSAYQYTDLTPNMWYSFSFYAKGNVDIGFMYAGTGNAVIDSIDVSWDDNTHTGFNTTSTSSNIIWLTPTNNWQRYSVVFHIEEQDITALHRLIGLYARPVSSYTEFTTESKDILITETGTDVHLIMEGNEVQICGYKLELGNKPTDWTPADNDKATYDNIISQINLSKEGIAIRADKIRLEGMITANEGFSIDEYGNMTANNGTFNGIFESYATEINENTFDLSINNGHIQFYNNDRTLTKDERYVGYIGGIRKNTTFTDGSAKNNDAITIGLYNNSDFLINVYDDNTPTKLCEILNYTTSKPTFNFWLPACIYNGNKLQMFNRSENHGSQIEFRRYSSNTGGYVSRGSLSLHSIQDNSDISDRLYLLSKNQGNDLAGDQFLYFAGKGLRYSSSGQPMRTGYVATDKYIVTQYFSLPDLTITKNTSQNFTIDVSRDGYTPIMCIPKVGGGQNAFYLSIYTWSISGNIVTIRTHNNSSTSDVSNVTISLQVLYKLTY